MSRYQKYRIHLDHILCVKNQLLKFGHLDEKMIQDIWIKSGEKKLFYFNNITYDINMPLYQKMILRFINCFKSPSLFYLECDPSNKQKLLLFYYLLIDDNKNINKVFNFFAWIKNYLTIGDILELDEITDMDKSILYKLWKNSNEIFFFFGLSTNKQNKLINKYNSYFN